MGSRRAYRKRSWLSGGVRKGEAYTGSKWGIGRAFRNCCSRLENVGRKSFVCDLATVLFTSAVLAVSSSSQQAFAVTHPRKSATATLMNASNSSLSRLLWCALPTFVDDVGLWADLPEPMLHRQRLPKRLPRVLRRAQLRTHLLSRRMGERWKTWVEERT